MRRTRATWSFNSCLAFAVLVFAHTADAQKEPSPGDVESAKASFSQGMDLRDKKDLTGALARFRAAYALVPTPITGLEVGRTLVDIGQVLGGRALLLEVSRMPKKAGESERAQEARDEAADLAEKSRARLAMLTIDTDARAEPAVTVDDVSIPKDAALAPRVVDPGHHVIVVHARGHIGRAEIDLAPGEQRQLRIETTEPSVRFHPGALFYASVAVAGAGLLVGISTGIAAVTTASSLENECPSHICPQSASGDLSTSLALGWISTLGFVCSGAGAIAAIITLATTRSPTGHREPASTQALRVQPGLGSLWITGSF